MPKHRLNKNNAQAAQALSQSQALTLPIVELDDSPKPFLIPELDTHRYRHITLSSFTIL